MHTTRIAIIGAGLSGLYAAYLLEQQGIRDYVLMEARATVGGRIASFSGLAGTLTGATTRPHPLNDFDLGPTWFWPHLQRELHQLVQQLGLERFAQHEAGDMMVERSHDAQSFRVAGYPSSPTSMRLAGGMGALIDALLRRLDTTRIVTGQVVRRLHQRGAHVEVESEDVAGHASTLRVEHVLLALPPRLAEASIAFSPALPLALVEQWRSTATWMAPHAKYIAVYARPFWREHGLSGEARSTCGPLGEIHDASMPGGNPALFGFFGVPAEVRQSWSDEVLRTHCRAQLVRLFGPQAAEVQADIVKDWAQDPFTATRADLESDPRHAHAPPATAAEGPWRGQLTGIGSEWSRQFPGYLAGAIEAARIGIESLPIGVVV